MCYRRATAGKFVIIDLLSVPTVELRNMTSFYESSIRFINAMSIKVLYVACWQNTKIDTFDFALFKIGPPYLCSLFCLYTKKYSSRNWIIDKVVKWMITQENIQITNFIPLSFRAASIGDVNNQIIMHPFTGKMFWQGFVTNEFVCFSSSCWPRQTGHERSA